MDIKAILSNLVTKGPIETWRISQVNRDRRKHESEFEKYYVERPFLKLEGAARKQYLLKVFEREKAFQAKYPDLYKKYLREMRRLYVKQRIPELYEKVSKADVKDKVIFMESGNSPSPTSSYISRVMTEEGKYDVHLTGLQIRAVSNLEFYENAMSFIEDMGDAKAVFLSTANDLLSHFDVRPETKVIQLWHGVGVFKKVGHSTVNSKNFGKSLAARQEYDQYRNYSYVTIAAEVQSWIFEESMNIDKDSGIIVPVGVSRTDVFYDENYFIESKKKLLDMFPQIGDKKIILYAPTFRGKVEEALAPDQLDVAAFAASLSDEYVLVIKHHGLSKKIPPIPEGLDNVFAFDVSKRKEIGIEGLLAVADICITDYSSLAFEYAIMERPLVFYAYDLEEYIDDRGLYYDYDEITPGPVCKTNEEMIEYIANIETRFNKQEIIDFKNKYVGACDGHATERTLQLLED